MTGPNPPQYVKKQLQEQFVWDWDAKSSDFNSKHAEIPMYGLGGGGIYAPWIEGPVVVPGWGWGTSPVPAFGF